MATKKELLKTLEKFDDDDVVVCMDENGGWDNIQEVKKGSGMLAIDTVENPVATGVILSTAS